MAHLDSFWQPPKVTSIKKNTTIILCIDCPYMVVDSATKEIDPGRKTIPVIKNGRALTPIWAVVEALGGKIEWDSATQKVTITLKNTTIELWIGKSIAKVKGVNTPIDSTNNKVVPEIINSRTMLPLRFITENLGCNVQWDGTTQTITITYGG